MSDSQKYKKIDKFNNDLIVKVSAVEDSLAKMLLEINHVHLQLLEEIKNKTKNSGIIHLSDQEILVKIFSGLKFYLDPRDIAVVPHLALDGVWEHRITAAWQAVLRSDDVVLDIGANFGYFGILAAQHLDPKTAKIVMFEANPNLMSYMQKTLNVNWLNEHTVIENLAIADKSGEVTLHVLKDYLGSSSLHDVDFLDKYMHEKMPLVEQEAIKVKAITIDQYCKKANLPNVNLIKIDIEGYEDLAYLGMRQTISSSNDVTLFIEFTPKGYRDPEAFYNTMLSDFGNVYLIDDNGRLKKQQDTSYNNVVGVVDDWIMPVFSKRENLESEI